jgi:hypothetical protein
VGRCRGCQYQNPSSKHAWFQRFKLQCDEPLSNFAFKFNLRCYSKGKRRRKTLGSKGGARSGSGSESESDVDDAFPFWALADEDLPVEFIVKKAKTS